MSELSANSSALDEETARADLYGLLAQLYYGAPAPELLAALRSAPTEAPAAGGVLEQPWRALVQTARDMGDAQVAEEHEALFGGLGQPAVYLFGSHYLTGFLNERPLIQLREDLTALGLARDETLPETEDHFACVCEVMRYLIAGEDVAVANLARQREFFAAHVQPWAPAMCEALAVHASARFYGALAGFTQAFLNVEQQGFDMLDSGA
jgi:TorA maturation chaperone TorD